MANMSSVDTSANMSIPGIVMKSALVKGKLSACCMNSQSICARKLSKLEELRNIAMVSKVDVMCLSESWLNETVNDDLLQIESYKIVRNDRVGRIGGGILVYLKNNLKFRVLEMSGRESETEYILLEAAINSEKILFGFFYNPPNVDCSQLLSEKFSSLDYQYDNILLMGDFNTNMLNMNSEKRNRFEHFLRNMSFTCVGSEPTHFHRTGSTQIDLMITNDKSKILKFNQVSVPFMSNHDLLFTSIDIDYCCTVDPISYRDYACVDPANIIAFYNEIDWSSFYQMNNPDLLVDFFTSNVKNLHDTCVPIKTFRKQRRYKPWFNSDISREIVNRDLAFEKWKNSQCEFDHAMYKTQRNKVTKMIVTAKENYIKSKFTNNISSKDLWKQFDNLGLRKKPADLPTDFSPDQINQHFCSNFTASNSVSNQRNIDNNLTPFQFNNVEEYHIVNAIYEIKSNAIGLDSIPIKFIKLILPLIIKPLKYLFNQILNTGIYPKMWKTSKIIPIRKKKSSSTLANLRPISILSALSKAFERVAKGQISAFIARNNLLSPYQSGYRSGHSIKTAMLRVCDDIGVVLDKGGNMVMILLDFSKAFDTISHANLCTKLKNQFGFSSGAVQLIRSYLSDRFQTVFCNDRFSSMLPISSGVPQGSVLGPLLFSLYINDLPTKLRNCKIHLFADDVTIYFDCTNMRQEEIELLINNCLVDVANWASENLLILNAQKTQAVFITRSRSQFEEPNLFLQNSRITFTNEVVSLGVTIQSNFEWDSFILKQCGKIYATLRSLRWKASCLSSQTKLMLFKALIYPHFLFCDFVLMQASANVINRLRVALNCCIRFIFNLNRFASVTHLQHFLIGSRFDNFIKMRSVVLLHKLVTSQAPQYLSSKMLPMRSQRGRKFLIPRHRTSHYGCSLFVRGISFWNELPSYVQIIDSTVGFKRVCLEYFS